MTIKVNGSLERSFGPARPSENQREIPELSAIPETVRSIFYSLPVEIQNKLFPLVPEGAEVRGEKSLDELAAGFDTETRERFMARCLSELFDTDVLGNGLKKIRAEELESELTRLLDVIWKNRGANSDYKIFNQEYYADFTKDRSEIVVRIEAIKEEVTKIESSIQSTIKQIRLTEQKKQELRNEQKKLDEARRELKDFDSKHGNSEMDSLYFRDVRSRQKKEKEWTEAAAVVARYLDPVEFATAVLEQLSSSTFYREMGDTSSIPEHRRQASEKIKASVFSAIEKWGAEHEDDGVFKKTTELRASERQAAVIEYFHSLLQSYAVSMKEGNRDVLYTVKQMEISLNVLKNATK